MALQGLAEAFSTLDAIPQAAREQLEDLLSDIADDELAAQRAAVPTETGKLKRGLGIDELLEKLRVRVGLLGTESNSRAAGNSIIDQLFANPGQRPSVPRNLGDVYYGRFVELGRKAQTVLVTRGTRASGKSASTRRRQAAGLSVRRPYKMRVRAMAPRPFVHRPDAGLRSEQRIADFWSGALDRAGAD